MACCITSDSSAVNEGNTVYFSLNTTNVKAGTTFAYTLSGVNAADVAGGQLTGIATTDASGKAIIAVTLLADNLTEGVETLTLNAAGKTASVTVNDTSVSAPLPVASADAFNKAHAAAVKAEADAAVAAATVTKAATDKDDADKKASDAQTKAILTDAAALKASSDTAAATAAKAVADNTAAQALVTTSQTNYDNAVAAGDVAAVSNTSAVLAINKSKADTAAKAVTTTATTAKNALDAYNSAAADDQAATDAATAATAARTALDKAIAAASPLTAAATAAAAADTTAASAYNAAALATANTADDDAGNAAPGAAAALVTKSAADAKAVSAAADALAAADAKAAADAAAAAKVIADAATEKANVATADAALAKYNTAASQYDTDLAAYNTADADATTAINAVSNAATATTAYNKSVTEQSAAATLVASAAAKSDAAKALKAATDATKATTDDAAATTAVTAASSNTTSAAKAKADADTQVATQKAKISDYDAKTFTLTKGLDNLVGGAGDDTFSGSRDTDSSADLNTASNIDTVDGGAGTGDKFKLSSTKEITAITDLPILSNIEILEITGSDKVTLDTTSVSGLTTLTVNKAGKDLKLTADASTNISVSNAVQKIEVIGGKGVTVSDGTKDNGITVGDSTNKVYAAGAISVTDSNQGTGVITVDGGTSVSVAATSKSITGNIAIGANKTASGAVSVTQNLNADGTGFDNSTKKITVKGGSTITVTSNATSTATASNDAGILTASAIEITSDGKTTDVSVTQTGTKNLFTSPVVAEVKDTTVVTFSALDKDRTVTVNGLTFTAGKDLTAEQVAAAFANLAKNDTQDAGGPTANGVYSNSSNTAAYTSGTASGKTVTFTAAGGTGDTLAVTGASKANGFTAGNAKSGGTKSTNSVTLNSVSVVDDATASVKTVTLDGFTTATLGGASTNLNALTTLSLKSGTDSVTLLSTSKTLAVTVNDLNSGKDVNLGGSVQTLTLTSAGKTSKINLKADAVKTLTIDAGAKLTLSDGTNYDTGLVDVTIKGASAVDLGNISAGANLKTFDASANTGGVTATLQGTSGSLSTDFKKYILSEGNDVITMASAKVNKDIALGGGDDSITLATGVRIADITATIDGGAGTNTLKLDAADAAALSADSAFNAKIDQFQRLKIGDTTAHDVINLANLDGISYLTLGTSSASGGTFGIQLDKLASNGTVVLTGAGDVVANVTNASTGTADVLNISATADTSGGDVDLGKFKANDVETINITTKDSFDSDNASYGKKQTLNLVANKAKTVTVSGDGNLTLTMDSTNTALQTLDGSSMTGKLVVTASVASMVVKGGSAADSLTAAANDVSLYGYGGGDTLTVSSGLRVNLYGNDGKDIFVINSGASSVLDGYTVINSVETGDVIKLGNATKFSATKIALSAGADDTVLNYANQAVKAIDTGTLAWFQKGGNTYIVEDVTSSGTNSDNFTTGEDIIVMIVGLIDLSKASYNSTSNSIEIG